MTSNKSVTVFGAYGHTGRFVVAELLDRGWTPVLSGRNADKLDGLAAEYPRLEMRPASVDDRDSLDRALTGTVAVVNCAGPFMDTAVPIVEAAVRARIHYLDVTAEQQSALTIFEQYGGIAHDAGIILLPAVAFYGGLGDLLATAAMGDWDSADEIRVAVALDSWKPTLGTRITGERNTAKRLVFSNNQLVFLADPPPTRSWNFPEPFGTQEVVGLALAEIITMSRHLRAREIRPYMNLKPLIDIRDPDTPTPTAVDKSGRSNQIFVMDVIARRNSECRRATVTGQDIYAITAPIVVEALTRTVTFENGKAGAFAAGELFNAKDFLQSLSPEHLQLEFSVCA